jgi:hypothetical protein
MNNNKSNVKQCKICDKIFSSRQSLWNHNNKYHNTPKPVESVNTNNVQPPKSSKSVHQQNKQTKKFKCEYCKYEFTRNDSLKRHGSRCKKKFSISDENKELKIIIEKQNEKINLQSKELKHVKTILMELMNKNCKIHPKQLQKINKQLGNNNTINENNGTINHNYIISLGNENLLELFSKKEKLKVLNNKHNSLPYLVEYTHFNDKYPQFKNILITNTQNDLAHKYDESKKQFIAVNKDTLLESIVDCRMSDIESFYEELETELSEKN